MKVYLASRWEQMPLMQLWRSALALDGIGCTAHWIDVAASGMRAVEGDDVMRREAARDFEDLREADALVCYNPKGGPDGGRGGRHAELGAALGMGKRVVLVGARTNIMHWHPGVVVVPEDVGALVRALQGIGP